MATTVALRQIFGITVGSRQKEWNLCTHSKHFIPQCIMNSDGMLSGPWDFSPFNSFMVAVSSEVVKGVVRWPPTPGTPTSYYIAS